MNNHPAPGGRWPFRRPGRREAAAASVGCAGHLLHPAWDDSRGWWPHRRANRTRTSRPTAARSSGGRYIMTQHRDLFAALAAPFDPDEVKLRSQAGRQLHYVTARTVMNRLDDVLGPENWWDDFVPLEHSVICRLTIRLPDGTTLTKADAGGYAGMADPGDDDKSGFADAFKRAAVKFGVAPLPLPRRHPQVRPRGPAGPRRGRARRRPTAAEPRRPRPGPGAGECPAPAGALAESLAAQRRRGPERAPERPGALRLDEGPGREVRVRPAEAHQRLGQAAGLPGPDGRLGGRAGHPGLFRGLPQDPRHPGHAARHRGRAVELTRPSRRLSGGCKPERRRPTPASARTDESCRRTRNSPRAAGRPGVVRFLPCPADGIGVIRWSPAFGRNPDASSGRLKPVLQRDATSLGPGPRRPRAVRLRAWIEPRLGAAGRSRRMARPIATIGIDASMSSHLDG